MSTMLDCEYSASHALSACQNPYSWKWHAIIAHNTGLRCMVKIWIKFTVTEELECQWHIQTVWEIGISFWVLKLWCPENSFQVFFFLLCFNKKYVKVVVNDFTMHLIILKWLRRQKCRQKKKMKPKDIEAKEETVYKSVFIHLNT